MLVRVALSLLPNCGRDCWASGCRAARRARSSASRTSHHQRSAPSAGCRRTRRGRCDSHICRRMRRATRCRCGRAAAGGRPPPARDDRELVLVEEGEAARAHVRRPRAQRRQAAAVHEVGSSADHPLEAKRRFVLEALTRRSPPNEYVARGAADGGGRRGALGIGELWDAGVAHALQVVARLALDVMNTASEHRSDRCGAKLVEQSCWCPTRTVFWSG